MHYRKEFCNLPFLFNIKSKVSVSSKLPLLVVRKSLVLIEISGDMELSEKDASRIVEMAWEDRTPFEAIKKQFGVGEAEVIRFMRNTLKRQSFKVWRERVSGRATKHVKLRSSNVIRGYCPTQYKQRK